jgi:His-Xaa-Ser system protein HxsD
MADNKISITVNRNIYPLEAAQAAARTFAYTAYAELSDAGAGNLLVTLTPREGFIFCEAALRGAFMNELLHHAIRLRVSAGNGKIREYIVTRALVSASPRKLRAKKPRRTGK